MRTVGLDDESNLSCFFAQVFEVSRVFFCTAMTANKLKTSDMAKKPFFVQRERGVEQAKRQVTLTFKDPPPGPYGQPLVFVCAAASCTAGAPLWLGGTLTLNSFRVVLPDTSRTRSVMT